MSNSRAFSVFLLQMLSPSVLKKVLPTSTWMHRITNAAHLRGLVPHEDYTSIQQGWVSTAAHTSQHVFLLKKWGLVLSSMQFKCVLTSTHSPMSSSNPCSERLWACLVLLQTRNNSIQCWEPPSVPEQEKLPHEGTNTHINTNTTISRTFPNYPPPADLSSSVFITSVSSWSPSACDGGYFRGLPRYTSHTHTHFLSPLSHWKLQLTLWRNIN